MDISQATEVLNDAEQRRVHAEKATRYLGMLADGLEWLKRMVGENGDGRYTYTMGALALALERLCKDAAFHASGAAGITDDDIPF